MGRNTIEQQYSTKRSLRRRQINARVWTVPFSSRPSIHPPVQDAIQENGCSIRPILCCYQRYGSTFARLKDCIRSTQGEPGRKGGQWEGTRKTYMTGSARAKAILGECPRSRSPKSYREQELKRRQVHLHVFRRTCVIPGTIGSS